MSCLECKVEWDGILEEMINNRVCLHLYSIPNMIGLQDPIAKDLEGIVCDGVLPQNFSASCNDFMGMYLPTVVSYSI